MFPCIQGITYDTGGADIKHGGSMAGMHRDKCGAAFVAGFFQVVNVYNCFISVTVLSLLLYIVYTYLDSFRNKSGKPQLIQTKVGKHAQLKGRQCPQNFGRDRLSGGKMGGSDVSQTPGFLLSAI